MIDCSYNFVSQEAHCGLTTLLYNVNLANAKIKFKYSAFVPAAAITKLKDCCTFSVGDVGSSIKEWLPENEAGAPTVAGDKLKATVTFSELPENNSSFGLKEAKLTCTVNGKYEIKNNYEVFFPKDINNHPTCKNCPDCPNWFYYWKKGNVCGIPVNAIYDSSTIAYGWCRPNVDSIIRLGAMAAKTNTGPETYTKDDTTKKITVTGTGKGIKCVAETISHEQYHITIFSNNNGVMDTDQDGVGNTAEANLLSIETAINDPDTYNLGGNYSGYGDNEIRCRKQEENPVSYDITKDWAWPGCQSENPFGP